MPKIWLAFGSQINQNWIDEYPEIVDDFEITVGHLSTAEREELLEFVAQVARSKTPREQAELWYASGAKFGLEVKGFPFLFSERLRILKADTLRAE